VRPITVRRPGAAVAALAAGLLVTALAGCGSSPGAPGIAGSVPGPAPAGGPAAGRTTGPAAGRTTGPAPVACALLRPADVLAVAGTFRSTTITIDGHAQSSQPPLNQCGFNQKGVYTSGDDTMTLSGDQWAQLTVIADGNDMGDYDPDGPAIHGLGHDAYWDPGSDAAVILVGQNVFQVIDDVPVNLNVYPNLEAAREQAATALAAKILSRVPAGA